MVVLSKAMFDHLTLLEFSFFAGNLTNFLVFFPLIIILLLKIKQIYYNNFVNIYIFFKHTKRMISLKY